MFTLKLAILVPWTLLTVSCAHTSETPTAQSTPHTADSQNTAESKKVETPVRRARTEASVPPVASSNQDRALSDENTTSGSTYSAEDISPTPGIRWSFWPMLVIIGIVTYVIKRRMAKHREAES